MLFTLSSISLTLSKDSLEKINNNFPQYHTSLHDNLKIYHDEEVEDNEFFGIQLANPSGRNVGLGQNKLVTKK